MYDINDYKLTKIENLDFKQNGFIYDKNITYITFLLINLL